jgi:hypothetical protein
MVADKLNTSLRKALGGMTSAETLNKLLLNSQVMPWRAQTKPTSSSGHAALREITTAARNSG